MLGFEAAATHLEMRPHLVERLGPSFCDFKS
jgi:hypothetical protein